MTKPQIELVCEHCATTFKVKASRAHARFCKLECRDAANRVEVACAVCDKRWEVKRSRAEQNASITCSPECLSEHLSRVKITALGTADQRTALCDACGTAFTRKPSQLAKYETNYCGWECSKTGRRGPNLKLRTGDWVPCDACATPAWRTPATRSERTFCSRACAGRPGIPRPGQARPSGEEHHWWRGGRPRSYRTPYAPGFLAAIKDVIRERDEHRCRICEFEPPTEDAWRLLVHHIDEQKGNHDPSNLILLCRRCHQFVHAGKVACPAA